VSKIVKVLHVSAVSVESFHAFHVSDLPVSKNLSAYDRHQRVASSQELLGS